MRTLSLYLRDFHIDVKHTETLQTSFEKLQGGKYKAGAFCRICLSFFPLVSYFTSAAQNYIIQLHFIYDGELLANRSGTFASLCLLGLSCVHKKMVRYLRKIEALHLC